MAITTTEGMVPQGNEYDIVCEEGAGAILDQAATAAVCDLVLREEGVSRPCIVSVTYVSGARIQELNAEWRGIDAATDVISLECERPDDPDLAEGEPCELGDIVLATDYVSRQAGRFGVTAQDECRLLLIHGMLHLLGYDHIEDEEAEAMEAREDELLALARIEGLPDHVELTRHREERP